MTDVDFLAGRSPDRLRSGRRTPRDSMATRSKNCEPETRYRRQSRRGSRIRRKSHSKPCSRIHCGARFFVPELMSHAAPTPTSTGTLRTERYSCIQRSCFGVLSPTQTTSGAARLMVSTISPLSSGVSVRAGGEYAPTIEIPGKCRRRDCDKPIANFRRSAVEKMAVAFRCGRFAERKHQFRTVDATARTMAA